MSITRADSFTANKRTQEYFSDFTTSFAKTPVGDQLARVVNVDAVNQSLRNIIKTNLSERLYAPSIGSNILASLFENVSEPLCNSLEMFVTRTIQVNEPRVRLIKVKVGSTSRNVLNDNIVSDPTAVDISISYHLINNPEPIYLNFILKRVR